jgi:hypothetical protein
MTTKFVGLSPIFACCSSGLRRGAQKNTVVKIQNAYEKYGNKIQNGSFL